jgi:TrpR family trp operon transcriptional repressor
MCENGGKMGKSKIEKDQGLQLFLKLCRRKSIQPKLDELLSLFFTPEERENISQRARIIQALIENKMTQREIAEYSNVSIGQITRGSNAIKIISPQLLDELMAFFKEES